MQERATCEARSKLAKEGFANSRPLLGADCACCCIWGRKSVQEVLEVVDESSSAPSTDALVGGPRSNQSGVAVDDTCAFSRAVDRL